MWFCDLAAGACTSLSFHFGLGLFSMWCTSIVLFYYIILNSLWILIISRKRGPKIERDGIITMASWPPALGSRWTSVACYRLKLLCQCWFWEAAVNFACFVSLFGVETIFYDEKLKKKKKNPWCFLISYQNWGFEVGISHLQLLLSFVSLFNNWNPIAFRWIYSQPS